MSLVAPRYQAEGKLSHYGLLLEIMTGLLMTFAIMLVLVQLAAALGVSPPTDIDFIAIAYG
jgi:hypothetical protein